MSKSYNRRFRKNGLSFLVCNTMQQDRKSDSDKYYLMVRKNDNYRIVYDNITWSIPKFATIHEAQYWALMSHDFIGTMD